ncbi:uncharacterized protein LOC123296602 [Chrysoperla carnea]|uniref:uncharacterized protein LOC123296602 n=1 Tax=Chrysoperla carnea TaxID=189513 RepID=UPI001D086034|nr:uncharacterized protein LOC123296602 [Chrysoperla carnea]
MRLVIFGILCVSLQILAEPQQKQVKFNQTSVQANDARQEWGNRDLPHGVQIPPRRSGNQQSESGVQIPPTYRWIDSEGKIGQTDFGPTKPYNPISFSKQNKIEKL